MLHFFKQILKKFLHLINSKNILFLYQMQNQISQTLSFSKIYFVFISKIQFHFIFKVFNILTILMWKWK